MPLVCDGDVCPVFVALLPGNYPMQPEPELSLAFKHLNSSCKRDLNVIVFLSMYVQSHPQKICYATFI